MAPVAEGLSAVHHGARLFLRLAGRWVVRADQLRTPTGSTRSRRSGGEPKACPVEERGPGSSTANRSRPPRAAGRAVEPVLGRGTAATRGTPPRRSKACPGAGRGPQAAYRDRYHRPDGRSRDPPRPRSSTGQAIRKTAMVRHSLSKPSMTSSFGCATSSPTAPIPGTNCSQHLPNSADGASKSSGAWPIRLASKSCRAVGSSNVPSLGSIATAAWPKTSRPPSPAPRPGSTLPPFSSSFAVWLAHNTTIPIEIRTLRSRFPRKANSVGCAGS